MKNNQKSQQSTKNTKKILLIVGAVLILFAVLFTVLFDNASNKGGNNDKANIRQAYIDAATTKSCNGRGEPVFVEGTITNKASMSGFASCDSISLADALAEITADMQKQGYGRNETFPEPIYMAEEQSYSVWFSSDDYQVEYNFRLEDMNLPESKTDLNMDTPVSSFTLLFEAK